MNIKLTEEEYQHFLIEIISASIEAYGELESSGNEDYVDWIYTLQRLKTKGVLSDLRPARNNVNEKSANLARSIISQFTNENEKYITTMM